MRNFRLLAALGAAIAFTTIVALPVTSDRAVAQTTDSITPSASPTTNVINYCYDFQTSLWKRIPGGNQGNIGDGVATPATGCVPFGFELGYIYNGTTWDRWRSAASQPASTQGAARVSTELGHQSQYNITAATNVKTGNGRLAKVSIIVSAATASTVCDSNVGCAANTTILSIPVSAPVGTVYDLNWPVTSGIRVEPGAGVTIAVSFE